MSAPNLLVIVVDGLAQQELPLVGPRSCLVPALAKLAQSGTVLTNCFAHGAPTEFAVPSLMTSTYPLDCGGYQSDYANRPPSFMKVAQSAGFMTGLVSKSFLLDRLYGFADGIDTIRSMYDIQVAWRYLQRASLYHTLERFEATGDTAALVSDAGAVLSRFLPFLVDLAARLAADRQAANRPPTRHLSYDFVAIHDRLLTEIDEMEKDPKRYVLRNAPRIMKQGLLDYLGLSPIARRIKGALAKFDGRHVPGTRILFRGYEKNVPSEYAFSALAAWIRSVKDKPSAGMIHLMDVHDSLYSSARYFMTVGTDVQSRIAGLDTSPAQIRREDLSLAYTDACIENIVNTLHVEGLFERTHIVITSDHGVQAHNGLTCLSNTSPAGPFKDIYLSVPLIISGPDVTHRVDTQLQQSLSIAPTICDLLGAETPLGYKGKSVFASDGGVDHVISEHMHRGPCDIANKPIYMAIRSAAHKYVWKEGFSNHDRSPHKHEQLFDLTADPDETTDVSESPRHAEILRRFRRLRQDRTIEIREQHPETAAAAC